MPTNPYVYVVTSDHPISGLGVDGVFLNLESAKQDIKASIEAESLTTEQFDIVDASLVVDDTEDFMLVYDGEGQASGIYYYITRKVLQE